MSSRKLYQTGALMSGRGVSECRHGWPRRAVRLTRLRCALAGVTFALWAVWVQAGDTAPVQVAVLGVELVAGDLSGDAEPTPEEQRRRELTAELLRDLFAQDGYAVVDAAATQQAIDGAQIGEFLHMCNGCELDLGRTLQVDWVLVAWVQRVSNLILNFNVVVRRVDNGQTIARSFVDLRGNNDKAWLRAARYAFQNSLREQLARQP